MGPAHLGGGKREVGAAMRKELLGPALLHHLDALGVQLEIGLVVAWIGVGMKIRTLARPHPASEGNVEAPVREMVQHREIFGRANRVPPRQDHRREPDANLPGQMNEIRAEENRVG